MSGMRTSLKEPMLRFRAGRIVNLIRVLALEVRREHSMDCAAVSMTRISMTMVCIGMHVEKWNHEHPEGHPREDHHARAGWLVTYPSH